MRLLSASIVITTVVGVLVTQSVASDLELDVVVFLDESVPGGTALLPLGVGIDLGDGKGFGFITHDDGDNNGMIHLPPIPVGGRLALGVQHDGGTATADPDCLIWEFFGTEVSTPGTTIEYPLLANASTGASLGIDYGEIAAPPIVLTPGDEFTVAGGVLPGWPGIRLVDDSGVPGLPEFIAAVDALPAFSGDVVASDISIRFTVVPEPSALTLATVAGLLVCLGRRRFRFPLETCPTIFK